MGQTIPLKCHKLESQGLGQTAKMHLKPDKEFDLTTITEELHFNDYVYRIYKGICKSQFLIQARTLMKGLKLQPPKYI